MKVIFSILILFFYISLIKAENDLGVKNQIEEFTLLYIKLPNRSIDFLDRLDLITQEAHDFVFNAADIAKFIILNGKQLWGYSRENKNSTTTILPELNELFDKIKNSKIGSLSFDGKLVVGYTDWNKPKEESFLLRQIGNDLSFKITSPAYWAMKEIKWLHKIHENLCNQIQKTLEFVEEIMVKNCKASEEEYRVPTENYVQGMEFFRIFEFKFDRNEPYSYSGTDTHDRRHKYDILTALTNMNKTYANETLQNLYKIINRSNNKHRTYKSLLDSFMFEVKINELKKCFTSLVIESKTFKYFEIYREFIPFPTKFVETVMAASICAGQNHLNDTKVMEQELLAIVNKTKFISNFTVEYLRNKFELAWELGVMKEVAKNTLIDYDLIGLKNRSEAVKKIQKELEIRGNHIWNYQVIISDATNSHAIFKDDSCFVIENYQYLNIYVSRLKNDSFLRAKAANVWLNNRQDNISHVLSLHYDQPLPFIASQLSNFFNKTLVDENRFHTFIMLRSYAFRSQYSKININSAGNKNDFDGIQTIRNSTFFINPLYSQAYNIIIYWVL